MRIGSGPLVAILALALGCHGGSSGQGNDPDPYTAGASEVPWTPGAWVQPVPAWGSTTRIAIPFALSSLSMADLGAFGSHQGGHPEGLDHVWLYNTASDQVQSWGPGTVTAIDAYPDQSMITIDYGDGLIGKHMSIQ
jgi:hypothetical protein